MGEVLFYIQLRFFLFGLFSGEFSRVWDVQGDLSSSRASKQSPVILWSSSIFFPGWQMTSKKECVQEEWCQYTSPYQTFAYITLASVSLAKESLVVEARVKKGRAPQGHEYSKACLVEASKVRVYHKYYLVSYIEMLLFKLLFSLTSYEGIFQLFIVYFYSFI